MDEVIETAADLHRALHKRGLDLNPNTGRDEALLQDLAARLGVPVESFTRSLEAKGFPAAVYLREFLAVAKPFALMFQEIWRYLARHHAPQAKERIRIRFGFDDDYMDMDLDQYREMVRSVRKVWAPGPVLHWPSTELFQLRRIFAKGFEQRSLLGYRPWQSLQLPTIEVRGPEDELAERVRILLQSLIDELHDYSRARDQDRRELPELQNHSKAESGHQDIERLAFLLTDLIPGWSAVFKQWDGVSGDTKQEALRYFEESIAPHVQAGIGGAFQTALEATDILALPFWKYRWHTYEIWASIAALEALQEYQPVPIIQDGRIPIDGSAPAVIACFSSGPAVFAHVQSKTPLATPVHGYKHIMPDLRFATDDPATNANTIGIVEYKQRARLTADHVQKVLAAYTAGTMDGGRVVLINYDIAPAGVAPPNCRVLGGVHPGNEAAVADYTQSIREIFSSGGVTALKRNRVVLLDVSSSMQSLYDSSAAQSGLAMAMDNPLIMVFRFNDGLLPGGDLADGQAISTGGGTQLGAALQQLYATDEARNLERMLIVTDGGHDHPIHLLGRLRDHKECRPDDLAEGLRWLLSAK